MKYLCFTALAVSVALSACEDQSDVPTEAPKVSSKSIENVSAGFSCEKSKVEIDAELKKQALGEVNESEYWELRQIEYNEHCEKIYDVE